MYAVKWKCSVEGHLKANNSKCSEPVNKQCLAPMFVLKTSTIMPELMLICPVELHKEKSTGV